MATFHNFFRNVTVDDASILAWLEFHDEPMPWETVDDMLCRPDGSLRRHIEGMVRRGLIESSKSGLKVV